MARLGRVHAAGRIDAAARQVCVVVAGDSARGTGTAGVRPRGRFIDRKRVPCLAPRGERKEALPIGAGVCDALADVGADRVPAVLAARPKGVLELVAAHKADLGAWGRWRRWLARGCQLEVFIDNPAGQGKGGKGGGVCAFIFLGGGGGGGLRPDLPLLPSIYRRAAGSVLPVQARPAHPHLKSPKSSQVLSHPPPDASGFVASESNDRA